MLKISAVAAAIGGVLFSVVTKGENPYSHGWLDFAAFLVFVSALAVLTLPRGNTTVSGSQKSERWGRALGKALNRIRRNL
jgi:hypothetical protein